ncbi:MAG: hypothetical protein K940chlam7_01847 [Chlamydiae bacterium]|nr:hypothetical protein [Chlamydiota bacterium]
MDLNKKHLDAMTAYQSKQYEKAAKAFSELIFLSMLHGIAELNIDDLMFMTIDSYRKLDDEGIVERIFQDYNDLQERYFRVVCHFLDYHVKNDKEKIQEEIHNEIPLSVADIRDFVFEEGMVFKEQRKVGPYGVSIVGAQGPRNAMEDAHLMTEIILDLGKKHKLQLFGVFDGHGGSTCAKYVQETLPDILKHQMEKMNSFNDVDIYNAVVRTFVLINDLWKDLPFQKTPHRNTSGTTAALCIILNQQTLWVATVGDSGVVIGDGIQAVQLSEFAKPTIEKYGHEILFRGGGVMWGRVDGSLDMARSIGDLDHPSVSARPTIRVFDLGKQNRLIIACDGLWDVVNPQEAIDAMQGKTGLEAAKYLEKLAYLKGSWDNVTVMVVDLNAKTQRRKE